MYLCNPQKVDSWRAQYVSEWLAKKFTEWIDKYKELVHKNRTHCSDRGAKLCDEWQQRKSANEPAVHYWRSAETVRGKSQ